MIHARTPSWPLPAGLFRMWCCGHILAAALFAGNITAARAQPAGDATGQDAAAPPAMDAAVARQLFPVVENWMRRGSVPDRTITYPVRRLAAVEVTIRIEGIPLGRGTAHRANPLRAASDRPTDAGPLLQRATRTALRHADQTLDRLATQSAEAETIPRSLAEAGPLLNLDLQCAGPLHRIALQQPSDVLEQMRVGLHGLTLRAADRWSWMFPGSAIAGNIRIESQIQRLLTEAQLDVTAMTDLGKDDGPTLYRFDAIHLVRAPDVGGDDGLTELARGQPADARAALSATEIRDLRRAWAGHLLSRQRPDGRFTGTYHPTSDRYRPALASARDAGLAVLALGRLAEVSDDADRAALYRQAARDGLTALLQDLELIDQPRKERPNPAKRTLRTAEAAIALIAWAQVARADEHPRVRERLIGILTAATDASGWFRNAAPASAPDATAATQALAGYALTRAFLRVEAPRAREAAAGALATLWGEVDVQRTPSAFPWGPLAEFRWLANDDPQPGLLTVIEAMDAVWQQQVEPPEADSPRSPDQPGFVAPDTVGGFRMTGQLVPEPTWRSAAMLAALAAAPRAPNVVHADQRDRWLVDLAAAFAFLDQLTIDAPDTWYIQRPHRAIGGVRMALWDNRLPLAATAMALLAAAEFQQTLDHRR